MRWETIAIALLVGAAAGCDGEEVFVEPTGGLHRMLVQPRMDPYEANPVFEDGKVMQHPPQGTVPRAEIQERGSVRSRALFVEQQGARQIEGIPIPVSEEVLEVGRERYQIYCAVCHGLSGYSATYIANRMELVRPPSLHEDRLRAMPPRYFYDVITQGYGAMPSYAHELGERERWAVAAFVQALQLSQGARLDELPAEDRRKATEAERKSSTGAQGETQ